MPGSDRARQHGAALSSKRGRKPAVSPAASVAICRIAVPQAGDEIEILPRTYGLEPTMGADMTQEFKSGQTVHLRRSLIHRAAADGDYKIVRRLPDTDGGGELQYRIKSVREPHERVVKESDLEKA
jgi:hypothetical protein